MPDLDYILAVQSWRNTPAIRVYSIKGERLASFPLDFVLRGGHPEWSYIIEAIHLITVVPAGSQWSLINSEGLPVSPTGTPQAGTYVYKCDTDNSLEPDFGRGPEYFRRFRAPTLGGSISTRSDSKRSSVNQNKFRYLVAVRDSACLVSGFYENYCTAAHIVPYSRPDVYKQILDPEGNGEMPNLFHPRFGLFLRDDLHHAYDRLEWSLYPKDGSFFVHFFSLAHPLAEQWHGMRIGPDRFRGSPENYPEPRLLVWHYKQCLMVHIRGFAVGMSLPEQP